MMRKLRKHSKQRISGMNLSWNEMESLRLDSLAMKELGLRMPRLSKKYLKAVYLLQSIYKTSAYFFHLSAARNGRDDVFRGVQKFGYTWTGDDWILR
jgi:hypothetical protein